MTAHIQYPKFLHPFNVGGLGLLVDTNIVVGIPKTIFVAIKTSNTQKIAGRGFRQQIFELEQTTDCLAYFNLSSC
ncbi:hypothetical protein D0A37_10055 [Microcoleus vaginatus HSN003]|nr:hypothetical protein D0A37_10055 [Microcoleus vaginatus HSN003]